MFLVALLYALFASVFTLSKVGLEYTEPLFFVGIRMVLGGILLLIYQAIRSPQSFQFSKIPISRLLRLALFNIYLTNVFEFWGLQYLPSFKTCFIYSLSPFLSALFSYFLFSERMSGKQKVGLCVGIVGFIPILAYHASEVKFSSQLLFLSWPELAVMAAVVTSVYGWILLKQLIKEDGCSPFFINGCSMLAGGVMALLHSYLVEDWTPVPVTSWMPFLECAIMLTIISNLICYNLYGYLLRKYSATFMSFAGFVTPLFTALFGWFYLGEIVTWPFYLSTAIVFSGLFLFHQEELKLQYRIELSAT